MKETKKRLYVMLLSLAMIISVLPRESGDAAAKISFSKSSIKISEGTSKKISLKTPNKYRFKKIILKKSTKKSVAKVKINRQKVVIKGLKSGKTKLTFKIIYKYKGKSKNRNIKVSVNVTSKEETQDTNAPMYTSHTTISPNATPINSSHATAVPSNDAGSKETPEVSPTATPTEQPTAPPTEQPTATPTEQPTEKPTAPPTEQPTATPTVQPTEKPTAPPTEQPTASPTALPSISVSGDQAIVENQSGLESALSNSAIKRVIAKSNNKITFTIPEYDYKDVEFVLDSPNADVENRGRFSKIEIKNIAEDTWHEYATGNDFDVTARKGHIVLEDGSEAKGIVFCTEGSSKGNIPDFQLEFHGGNTDKISIEKDVNLDIMKTGDVKYSDAMEIRVEENNDFTTINTEIRVDVETDAIIAVNTSEQAGGSVVEAEDEYDVVFADNASDGDLTLVDSENNEHIVESGEIAVSVDAETFLEILKGVLLDYNYSNIKMLKGNLDSINSRIGDLIWKCFDETLRDEFVSGKFGGCGAGLGTGLTEDGNVSATVWLGLGGQFFVADYETEFTFEPVFGFYNMDDPQEAVEAAVEICENIATRDLEVIKENTISEKLSVIYDTVGRRLSGSNVDYKVNYDEDDNIVIEFTCEDESATLVLQNPKFAYRMYKVTSEPDLENVVDVHISSDDLPETDISGTDIKINVGEMIGESGKITVTCRDKYGRDYSHYLLLEEELDDTGDFEHFVKDIPEINTIDISADSFEGKKYYVYAYGDMMGASDAEIMDVGVDGNTVGTVYIATTPVYQVGSVTLY